MATRESQGVGSGGGGSGGQGQHATGEQTASVPNTFDPDLEAGRVGALPADNPTEASSHLSFKTPSSDDIESASTANGVHHEYISSHRDPFAEKNAQPDLAETTPQKKPWWAFWRAVGSNKALSDFVTPNEWLLTPLNTGLSEDDVVRRRRFCGWNELVTEKENMLLKFLYFFSGPILYVMELAALIALLLQDWIEFGVIIGILLLNAGVGWYQEKQISLLAADVVASLRGDITMTARVIRGGNRTEIKARELVPGDIIIIEDGDVIPADARIICDFEGSAAGYQQYLLELQQHNADNQEHGTAGEDGEEDVPHPGGGPILAVDQSAMTGESHAVDKHMLDTIYYTTGCRRGKAYAIVTHVAPASLVGKTAILTQGAQDQGHFKAIMNSIGTALLVLVVFFILAAWIGGFYRNIRIIDAEDSPHSLVRYMLSLLIIGVPVGLPVVTTTTLAVGAAYLANEKAIVQKLTAIESLAGVDILCSDKTGTLTANRLSQREPFVMEGVDINWMMTVAALASSHNVSNLDPIDKITVLSVKRYPVAKAWLARDWRNIHFEPFNPVSKLIEAVKELDGVRYTCIKGSATSVLAKCNGSPEHTDIFRRKARELASRGFRCLAVAVKKNDEPWELLGMMSLFDPPRSDTAETIAEAQALGLSVKMLTGDACPIAKETCKMLAMGTKIYKADSLSRETPGTAIHDLCERADGFAEVFPKHKYLVVEKLQERGHLTAMTGDGVNDAPSLKKSDCGIAVEGATEAAQAAADIVLLEPGLKTIISAIKISRQIFQRMKAYIQYRIALCLHLEIYLVTCMLGINETLHLPLVAFLALFADLATIAVGFDNAHYEMRPVEWQLPKIWIISVVLGVLLTIGTWVLRGTLWLSSGGVIQDYGSIQGILFLEITLTQNWLIFVTRGFKTWPSFALVAAIAGVDILAVVFAHFGWMTGGAGLQSTPPTPAGNINANGQTDWKTIAVVFLYSVAVSIVAGVVYHVMTEWTWLNDIGRTRRSRTDTEMENVLARLGKIAIEHVQSGGEVSRYYLETRQDESDDE